MYTIINRIFKPFLVLLISLFCSLYIYGEELNRRVQLGLALRDLKESEKANLKFYKTGCYVDSVISGSNAMRLGFKKADIIVMLNNQLVSEYFDVTKAVTRLRDADSIKILILRQNDSLVLSGILSGMKKDEYDYADVIYDDFKFQNGQIRRILIKPKGRGKYPVIFFIPGYTCNSIDNLGDNNAYEKILTGLVKAGFAVCKTEKPGLGDSYGTDHCRDIDLYTEINSFETSYNSLVKYDFIDTSNIFIFGHSMGGVIAPLIKTDIKPKGIAVYGTVVRSWFEYFIEQMRTQMLVTGEDYYQNDSLFNERASFYYEYMINKKSPEELKSNKVFEKILSDHWSYTEPHYMSGRHYKFWQQLQDCNLIGAWSKFNGKVLSIWGEGDFIAFSKYDHQLLSDLINHYHPGNGKFVSLPNSDHGFVYVKDMEDAVVKFRDYKYRIDNFNYSIVNNLTNWLTSCSCK